MWVVGCLSAAVTHMSHAEETSPANVAAARRHYDAARDDYAKGAYREAITELEAAHTLDPNAKDLIFNLGVVHEKLTDIDEALKWFRLYTTMDLTVQEGDRAEAYLRRLEGAKKELDEKKAAEHSAAPVEPASPPAPPPPPEPGPHGRVDGVTVLAAGLTVAALGFGIVLSARAVEDAPPPNYVTGHNGSYNDLVNQQELAHREAIFADVGFGVAVLGAAATAALYFGRRRDPSPSLPPSTGGVGARVSLTPTLGGGALLVQGFF
jgi:tetratricopeptide (TPR) repeat protein